jgi:hypothetical protein
MLDAVGIDFQCINLDAQNQEKFSNNLVLSAALVGHRLTGGCQKDGTLG